ncbi:MAG: hypothetical protein ACERKD_23520 [Prolixibacteraceae bacterium]
MNKIFYFSLIFIFLSCEKNENAPSPPEIKITIVDDIIPTQVHFEVDDVWEDYYWRYNKTHGSGNMPAHNDIYSFREGGTATVQLTVYKDSYTITVDSTFSLPSKRCDKLKIYGITFTSASKQQVQPYVNLRVDFTTNDDSKQINSTTFTREINDSKFEYLFDMPIIYSIGQYWSDANLKSVRVFLDLYNDNDIKVYSNEFSLTDRGQMFDNDLFDGGLQTLTMMNHNSEIAFLNIDLIPEE